MNLIDMTFEEKVEQVIKANRIPSGQGFNFLRFQEIGLHQIVQRTGNVLANAVRSQGLDLEYVAAFTDRINEGRYFFTYEQPVVKPLGIKNEKGEDLFGLICGEHRLGGHKGAKRPTMFCGVGEFDSEEDEMIFQSNENDEDDEYIKSPRTLTDVISTLSQMVDKGIIDIDDDKSINQRLIRLNQKTNEFPMLREQLRTKYGMINPVKSYSDEDRRQWCREHRKEVQFSSRSNIIPMDGVVYQSKTFKGGKGPGGLRDLDYDPRCFFDSCSLLMQKDVTKVHNICSVNKSTSEKIPKIRDYKKNEMMQEMLDQCIKIVDFYRAGLIDPINDVTFDFLPQISGTDNMEELV